jgi:hypothetical protein
LDVKNVCIFVASWILGFWSSATIIITTTTTTARSLEQLILGPEYHLSHLSHLAAFEDQTQKVERFLSPSLWSPWRRLSFDGTSKSCSFGTLCGLEHHRYGPLIPEKTQDIFSHRNHQLGARQTNYCSPSPTSPVAGRKHSPAGGTLSSESSENWKKTRTVGGVHKDEKDAVAVEMGRLPPTKLRIQMDLAGFEVRNWGVSQQIARLDRKKHENRRDMKWILANQHLQTLHAVSLEDERWKQCHDLHVWN